MPTLPNQPVSQSQRKLEPLHREAIFRWREPGSRQKTLRQCVELLAAGSKDWPPVKVSEETVSATYRRLADDRGALRSSHMPKARQPPTERLDAMVRRLVDVGERETARVERMEARGKLDAGRLLKLARALRSLYDLQERAEREPDATGDDDQAQPQADAPSEPTLAERLAATPEQPGPPDLPDQDTTEGTKVDGGVDGSAGTETMRSGPASEAPISGGALIVGLEVGEQALPDFASPGPSPAPATT